MTYPIRVRIAPSPSGFLHIGTAKMALFNWLFARSQGGTFILRLEDTDADRTEEAFVHAMCEGFHWLGIDWDEGPAFGDVHEKGECGPYRQSQRKELHQREALRLVEEGHAYKCFSTKEELAAIPNSRYDGAWRDATPEQVAAMGDAPYVVRLRIPEGETIIHDLVQGDVRIQNKEIDDFVILKPNGDPIFHLAVVVDDAFMKITHVIRGDDHLTNCVRHIMLFNALGFDPPVFAHLPMVLDDRGKKYSKRDRGANVLDWRDDGYLPEAIINYVALLGWTPSEPNRELFSREELIAAFDVNRLGASAAKFDRKKLDWLNGQHIRRLTPEQLRDKVVPILHKAGLNVSKHTPEWLARMAAVCQEKIPTLNDIVGQAEYFFREPERYEEKGVNKYWRSSHAGMILAEICEVMGTIEPFTHDVLKSAFEQMALTTDKALGAYIHPARLALTGKTVGPGLFELAELMGRDLCLVRLCKAMEYVDSL